MSDAAPVEPGPGQESVWDYPRPPRVETTDRHLVIETGGKVIADTRAALRVLETSHPPTYYLPVSDIAEGVLHPSSYRSYCEFKGEAHYFSVVVDDVRRGNAAWHYPEPSAGYEELRDHVAFYAGKADVCRVDGEVVEAQPETEFYGGWVTSDVVGPFKGAPGTYHW